jgi:hypothetical protein
MQVKNSSKWPGPAEAQSGGGSQIPAFTDLQASLCGPRSEQICTELMSYMNGLEQEMRKRITTRLRPDDYEICTAVVNAAAAAQTVLAQQSIPMPDAPASHAPTPDTKRTTE